MPKKAKQKIEVPDPPRSVEYVAAQLGHHPRTTWRLIAEGELTAFKIRGLVRIYQSDIDTYIARCRIKPADERASTPTGRKRPVRRRVKAAA